MPRISRLTPPLISVSMLLAATSVVAGENVDYQVDGESFQGYFAPASPDSSSAKGSVLIIHDWDGLTDYEKRRADMLAEDGYDAFAIDLYGKGNRPAEIDARKAEMAALYDDRERMRDLTLAGLAKARDEGAATDTVVMGYCFGGAVVLEMARANPDDAIHGFASFHGGLDTPEGQGYSADTPPLLIAHGGADASISMDQVAALSQELEAAGAPYEIQVYSGAPHAFTVFDSERYQQRADEASWAAFHDLLSRTLSNGQGNSEG